MGGVCENCAKVENCKKTIGIIWGFCTTDFEEREDRKMRITITEKEIRTVVEAIHDLADEYEQIFDACGWDSEDVAARRKQYEEMLTVARKLKGKLPGKESAA